MADNNINQHGSKVWEPEYESKVEKDNMTIFTLLYDENNGNIKLPCFIDYLELLINEYPLNHVFRFVFNDKNRFGLAANIFIEIHIRYKPLYSEKNIENFIKSNYKNQLEPDIYSFNMSKNYECFYGTCILNKTTKECNGDNFILKIFSTIFRD